MNDLIHESYPSPSFGYDEAMEGNEQSRDSGPQEQAPANMMLRRNYVGRSIAHRNKLNNGGLNQ